MQKQNGAVRKRNSLPCFSFFHQHNSVPPPILWTFNVIRIMQQPDILYPNQNFYPIDEIDQLYELFNIYLRHDRGIGTYREGLPSPENILNSFIAKCRDFLVLEESTPETVCFQALWDTYWKRDVQDKGAIFPLLAIMCSHSADMKLQHEIADVLIRVRMDKDYAESINYTMDRDNELRIIIRVADCIAERMAEDKKIQKLFKKDLVDSARLNNIRTSIRSRWLVGVRWPDQTFSHHQYDKEYVDVRFDIETVFKRIEDGTHPLFSILKDTTALKTFAKMQIRKQLAPQPITPKLEDWQIEKTIGIASVLRNPYIELSALLQADAKRTQSYLLRLKEQQPNFSVQYNASMQGWLEASKANGWFDLTNKKKDKQLAIENAVDNVFFALKHFEPYTATFDVGIGKPTGNKTPEKQRITDAFYERLRQEPTAPNIQKLMDNLLYWYENQRRLHPDLEKDIDPNIEYLEYRMNFEHQQNEKAELAKQGKVKSKLKV